MRLKRPRRHLMEAHRQARPAAGAISETWAMDFVSDALFDGHRIRALTVVGTNTTTRISRSRSNNALARQLVAR